MYADIPPPLDVAAIVAPQGSSMPLNEPNWQELLGARQAAGDRKSVV